MSAKKKKPNPEEDDTLCQYCNNVFSSKLNLEKHISNSHNLLCPDCGEIFHCKKKWNRHIAKGHDYIEKKEVGKFKCEICEKRFTQKATLGRHLDNIHNLRCRICDITFETRRELLVHNSEKHTDTSNLKCDVCDMVFSRKDNFLVHLERKHSHKCDNCEDSFLSEDILIEHFAANHSKFEILRCYVCKQAYSIQEALDQHVYHDHPFKCKDCGRHFHTRKDLVSHSKTKHTEGKRKSLDKRKPVKCGICEMVLDKVQSYMDHHEEFHTNLEHVFRCVHCNQDFPSDRRLDNHIRIHMQTSKYEYVECPLCNTVFRRTNHLKRHYKTLHPGETPCIEFKCLDCDVVFKSRHQIKKHAVKVHNKGGHECFNCKAMFDDENKLKEHMQIHVKPDVDSSNDDSDDDVIDLDDFDTTDSSDMEMVEPEIQLKENI